MSVFIHHLSTLVPPHAYSQEQLCARLTEWQQNPLTARLTRQLFRRSAIARRYSVLPDFHPETEPELFHRDGRGRLLAPSTGARNACYVRHANDLSVQLARQTLAECQEFDASDITHVITVSCTGFYNPGPDYAIVTQLGLPPSVERYHLGFMGCYAALPALRMAQQFCRTRPDAVVLVICLELCSLHLQLSDQPDSALANTLFSDGAAAALVSARPPSGKKPALVLEHFRSALATEGKKDMAWTVGDSGFNLVLSSYVPEVIAANIAALVDDLLLDTPRCRQELDWWAVHPGGRAILDQVEKSLDLRAEQITDSRSVLRDYGNMSSATILFVLQRLLERRETVPRSVCAMAFGPGLTIETALLEMRPATCGRMGNQPKESAALAAA